MGKRREDNRPPCTGRRADGRPCAAKALPGTSRCWHHSYKVPGRPTKLTAELQETIIDAVLDGAYLETAAQAAGINKTTLYRWLRRADEAEAVALEQFDSDSEPELAELYNHIDPAEWVYLDFRHALKSTEAWAELELLRMARRGGNGWQAQMTVLERRHPAKWGRRDTTRHEHSGTVAGKVELVTPDTNERRTAVAGILSQAGALDPENTTTQEDPDEPTDG